MLYNPKVSIIILNWNGMKDTIECLESVRKIDYPSYEVIVVDNDSADSSPEEIKRLVPKATLIKNKENLGFAGGNNVGIRYALERNAEYVWLLNNDTTVKADALTNLVASSEASSKIGLASPIIYDYFDRSKAQFRGAYFDYKNFFVELYHNDSISELHKKDVSLWGTALLVKREIIDKIGYLNEKYFAYWEDGEYSYRVLRAGYINIIEPSATVFHKYHVIDEKRTLPPHFYYYMTRNEYFFWTENIPNVKKMKFLRRYLIRILRDIDYSKNKLNSDNLKAIFDGIYCGFFNIGGKWNKNKEMPSIIQKQFSRHPYFFANLLEGNLRRVF